MPDVEESASNARAEMAEQASQTDGSQPRGLDTESCARFLRLLLDVLKALVGTLRRRSGGLGALAARAH